VGLGAVQSAGACSRNVPAALDPQSKKRSLGVPAHFDW
jgi:hypothetical protein